MPKLLTIPLNIQQMLIRWMPEDELPQVSSEIYENIFRCSEIIDGVRCFPYVRVPPKSLSDLRTSVFFLGRENVSFTPMSSASSTTMYTAVEAQSA